MLLFTGVVTAGWSNAGKVTQIRFSTGRVLIVTSKCLIPKDADARTTSYFRKATIHSLRKCTPRYLRLIWPADAGGALSLLYVIDDGIKADDEKRARSKDGTVRADDYRPRSI